MRKPEGELRRGWTTGACATAAVKAALAVLWGNEAPQPVQIVLPKGETPRFEIAHFETGDGWVEIGITKDAGDDPDVTHGALIIVRVCEISAYVVFKAGEGVGTITKPGLPIPPGEPAINPVPRQMMTAEVTEAQSRFGTNAGIQITVSIPGGQEIAKKTWNPRLGIKGGLSILGTTGVVRPFSCAAWIASIHRGIDVARAEGLPHVAGCTGATSETAVQKDLGLPDHAMLDMGDFVGGMLKYISKNPVPKITIGGGLAKLTKLGQGARDLHSGRSQVDFDALSLALDAADIALANTVLEVQKDHEARLVPWVLENAQRQAQEILKNDKVDVDVIAVARDGRILGRT